MCLGVSCRSRETVVRVMGNDVPFEDADPMARIWPFARRGVRTSGSDCGAVYHEISMQGLGSRLLVQIRRIRACQHRRGRQRVLGHYRHPHKRCATLAPTSAGYTAGGETTRESVSARAKALGGQPAISRQARLACEPSANPATCAASVTDPPPATYRKPASSRTHRVMAEKDNPVCCLHSRPK
jgi:hypothetical protein